MPIALALAFSALLHAAAIVMPGWDLPGAGEPEPVTLEAHLAPPPRPAAPPAAKPKPHPLPTKKTPLPAVPAVPAAVGASSVAADEPQPVSAPEPVAPVAPVVEAPPAPAAVPAPPKLPWPPQGRVRYPVTYGEGGFVIGETIHEWRIEDGRYSIRSVFAPKGLAAMVGKTRAQVSSGEVTADGLRPDELRDQREGRAEEAVSFDWTAGRATFSGGRGSSPVAPGTQDVVSVFYQLAWLAPQHDVELAVATAGRVGRWNFEWLGEEKLDLGIGVLSTLHLRTRADGDTTEIWLAPAHGGLPVKIRHIDRKGDVFEQTADLLELKQ